MTYQEACRQAAKEWCKLAKRLDRGQSYREDGFLGMCAEVMHAQWNGAIAYEARAVMDCQLGHNMAAYRNRIWYDRKGNMAARVLPCLMLAEEARDMANRPINAYFGPMAADWILRNIGDAT